MAKTNNKALVKALVPAQEQRSINFAVFVDAVPEMTTWRKDEQTTTQQEIVALIRAVGQEHFSRLEQGARLRNIQKLFESKGSRVFVKFLRVFEKTFHVKQRTAYRMIEEYQRAAEQFTEPVIKAALSRGVNLGSTARIDQETRKILGPPPRNPDPEVAERYVGQYEDMRKQLRSKRRAEFSTEAAERDPQVLLHEALVNIHQRYNRLPTRGKARLEWVDDLVSYIFTMAGVTSARSIRPTAIPEGWLRGRGRPKNSGASSA